MDLKERKEYGREVEEKKRVAGKGKVELPMSKNSGDEPHYNFCTCKVVCNETS